jgi:hypothetical protein
MVLGRVVLPSDVFAPPHLPDILLCEAAADERLQMTHAAFYPLRGRPDWEKRRTAAGCVRFTMTHVVMRESNYENHP